MGKRGPKARPKPVETAPRSAGRPPRVPEKLHPWLLERAAEGLSSEAIAKRLEEEHGIRAGHASIWRTLKALRQARGEVTQAVVAEKVGRTVARDMDVLREQLEGVTKVANALRDQLIDPMTGEPLPGIDGCIGKTPRVAVYQSIVGRAESIAGRILDLAGVGNGKPKSDGAADGAGADVRPVIVVTGKTLPNE